MYDDPLIFRVEFVKLFDRVWKINGYATNTFDEEITVRWGCPPCVFAFFYPIPDEDLNLLVGQYGTKFYNLKYYNKWFEFEPGEEKLIENCSLAYPIISPMDCQKGTNSISNPGQSSPMVIMKLEHHCPLIKTRIMK